jgi:DNA-binding LytR/AlgR family response regulator
MPMALKFMIDYVNYEGVFGFSCSYFVKNKFVEHCMHQNKMKLLKIQRILQAPHPFIFNRYSVLLPSLITFLVLVILRPFDFDTFQTIQLIAWSLSFAVLVGATIFLSGFVVKRYFRKTIEENWTVKNEILLILFVLAVLTLMIYLFFSALNPQTDPLELFGVVVVRTLAISFFPVLIMVLYDQNHHQKLKRRQAEILTRELVKRKDSEPQRATLPEKIILVAENKKAALQIDPVELFFVRSEGNYVEVYYHQNQKVQKELIRNSLKAIEEQLSFSDFFRCHNRFLINLRRVLKVEGNARNLELVLERVDEKIPVSRSKSEKLLQLFQKNAE